MFNYNDANYLQKANIQDEWPDLKLPLNGWDEKWFDLCHMIFIYFCTVTNLM